MNTLPLIFVIWCIMDSEVSGMGKKISRVCLRAYILSAIFFFIFVLQISYVLRCNMTEFKSVYLLIALPPIIALTITILTLLHIYEKKKFLRITAVILLIISTIPMICSWFYYRISNEHFYESDIEHYRQIINIEGYPFDKKISHFPSKITSDMENARFCFSTYLDMFTYCGEHMLLIYKTTPTNLEALKNRYIKHDAKKTLTKENDISGILNRNYIDSDGNTVELPEDFEAYILELKSNKLNHNDISLDYVISGIAVSDERCEVIYFYEHTLE